MQQFSRLVGKLNPTIVLYFVAAIALFYIVTDEKVSEAILAFCFGGVLPGSGRVISPEVMMLWASGLIGFVILSVLLLWIVRIVEVRRAAKYLLEEIETSLTGMHHTSKSKAAAAPAPMLAEHDYVVAKHPEPSKAPKLPRRSGNHVWLRRTQAQIMTHAQKLRVMITADVRWLAMHVTRLSKIVWRASREFGITVIAVILIAARVAATQTKCGLVRFWAWLEPRALCFDTWLELQYRKSTSWLQHRLMNLEIAKVLSLAAHDSIKTLRQLFK